MTKGQAASLQSLHDWMRLVGATKVVLTKDTMELSLGEPVPSKLRLVPDDSPAETDDQRAEREEQEGLEVLLHSSGASIVPFLKRSQK